MAGELTSLFGIKLPTGGQAAPLALTFDSLLDILTGGQLVKTPSADAVPAETPTPTSPPAAKTQAATPRGATVSANAAAPMKTRATPSTSSARTQASDTAAAKSSEQKQAKAAAQTRAIVTAILKASVASAAAKNDLLQRFAQQQVSLVEVAQLLRQNGVPQNDVFRLLGGLFADPAAKDKFLSQLAGAWKVAVPADAAKDAMDSSARPADKTAAAPAALAQTTAARALAALSSGSEAPGLFNELRQMSGPDRAAFLKAFLAQGGTLEDLAMSLLAHPLEDLRDALEPFLAGQPQNLRDAFFDKLAQAQKVKQGPPPGLDEHAIEQKQIGFKRSLQDRLALGKNPKADSAEMRAWLDTQKNYTADIAKMAEYLRTLAPDSDQFAAGMTQLRGMIGFYDQLDKRAKTLGVKSQSKEVEAILLGAAGKSKDQDANALAVRMKMYGVSTADLEQFMLTGALPPSLQKVQQKFAEEGDTPQMGILRDAYKLRAAYLASSGDDKGAQQATNIARSIPMQAVRNKQNYGEHALSRSANLKGDAKARLQKIADESFSEVDTQSDRHLGQLKKQGLDFAPDKDGHVPMALPDNASVPTTPDPLHAIGGRANRLRMQIRMDYAHDPAQAKDAKKNLDEADRLANRAEKFDPSLTNDTGFLDQRGDVTRTRRDFRKADVIGKTQLPPADKDQAEKLASAQAADLRGDLEFAKQSAKLDALDTKIAALLADPPLTSEEQGQLFRAKQDKQDITATFGSTALAAETADRGAAVMNKRIEANGNEQLNTLLAIDALEKDEGVKGAVNGDEDAVRGYAIRKLGFGASPDDVEKLQKSLIQQRDELKGLYQKRDALADEAGALRRQQKTVDTASGTAAHEAAVWQDALSAAGSDPASAKTMWQDTAAVVEKASEAMRDAPPQLRHASETADAQFAATRADGQRLVEQNAGYKLDLAAYKKNDAEARLEGVRAESRDANLFEKGFKHAQYDRIDRSNHFIGRDLKDIDPTTLDQPGVRANVLMAFNARDYATYRHQEADRMAVVRDLDAAKAETVAANAEIADAKENSAAQVAQGQTHAVRAEEARAAMKDQVTLDVAGEKDPVKQDALRSAGAAAIDRMTDASVHAYVALGRVGFSAEATPELGSGVMTSTQMLAQANKIAGELSPGAGASVRGDMYVQDKMLIASTAAGGVATIRSADGPAEQQFVGERQRLTRGGDAFALLDLASSTNGEVEARLKARATDGTPLTAAEDVAGKNAATLGTWIEKEKRPPQTFMLGAALLPSLGRAKGSIERLRKEFGDELHDRTKKGIGAFFNLVAGDTPSTDENGKMVLRDMREQADKADNDALDIATRNLDALTASYRDGAVALEDLAAKSPRQDQLVSDFISDLRLDGGAAQTQALVSEATTRYLAESGIKPGDPRYAAEHARVSAQFSQTALVAANEPQLKQIRERGSAENYQTLVGEWMNPFGSNTQLLAPVTEELYRQRSFQIDAHEKYIESGVFKYTNMAVGLVPMVVVSVLAPELLPAVGVGGGASVAAVDIAEGAATASEIATGAEAASQAATWGARAYRFAWGTVDAGISMGVQKVVHGIAKSIPGVDEDGLFMAGVDAIGGAPLLSVQSKMIENAAESVLAKQLTTGERYLNAFKQLPQHYLNAVVFMAVPEITGHFLSPDHNQIFSDVFNLIGGQTIGLVKESIRPPRNAAEHAQRVKADLDTASVVAPEHLAEVQHIVSEIPLDLPPAERQARLEKALAGKVSDAETSAIVDWDALVRAETVPSAVAIAAEGNSDQLRAAVNAHYDAIEADLAKTIGPERAHAVVEKAKQELAARALLAVDISLLPDPVARKKFHDRIQIPPKDLPPSMGEPQVEVDRAIDGGRATGEAHAAEVTKPPSDVELGNVLPPGLVVPSQVWRGADGKWNTEPRITGTREPPVDHPAHGDAAILLVTLDGNPPREVAMQKSDLAAVKVQTQENLARGVGVRDAEGNFTGQVDRERAMLLGKIESGGKALGVVWDVSAQKLQVVDTEAYHPLDVIEVPKSLSDAYDGKRQALSEHERARLDDLKDNAGSPEEQLMLMRAFAVRGEVGDAARFADVARYKEDGTKRTPREIFDLGTAAGLMQYYKHSCSPTSFQLRRAHLDPNEAVRMVLLGPEALRQEQAKSLEAIDAVRQQRFVFAQIGDAAPRRMTRDESASELNADGSERLKGVDFATLADQANAAGAAPPGQHFVGVEDSSTVLVDRLLNELQSGNGPMVIGLQLSEARGGFAHAVTATRVVSENGRTLVEFIDPTDGQTQRLSVEQLRNPKDSHLRALLTLEDAGATSVINDPASFGMAADARSAAAAARFDHNFSAALLSNGEVGEQGAFVGHLQDLRVVVVGREIPVLGAEVKGLSPDTSRALARVFQGEWASVDIAGAANVDHLTSVFEGVLVEAARTKNAQRAREGKAPEPLTQGEVDQLARDTVLTDATGKGRSWQELQNLELAPLVRLVFDANGKIIGRTPLHENAVSSTGADFHQLAMEKNPALFGNPALGFFAGTGLHGIVHFSFALDAAFESHGIELTAAERQLPPAELRKKYPDVWKSAQQSYEALIGHHMAGFVAAIFANAGVSLDFKAMAEQGFISEENQPKLQALYEKSIEVSGKWRKVIDKEITADTPQLDPKLLAEYKKDAAGLAAAAADLPPHIRSQLLNDDAQQFTSLGIEKWVRMNAPRKAPDGTVTPIKGGVVADRVRVAAEQYRIEGDVRGDGSALVDASRPVLARTGSAYDEGGHFFRRARPGDPEYALFEKQILADPALAKEYRASGSKESPAEWMRAREVTSVDDWVRLAQTPPRERVVFGQASDPLPRFQTAEEKRADGIAQDLAAVGITDPREAKRAAELMVGHSEDAVLSGLGVPIGAPTDIGETAAALASSVGQAGGPKFAFTIASDLWNMSGLNKKAGASAAANVIIRDLYGAYFTELSRVVKNAGGELHVYRDRGGRTQAFATFADGDSAATQAKLQTALDTAGAKVRERAVANHVSDIAYPRAEGAAFAGAHIDAAIVLVDGARSGEENLARARQRLSELQPKVPAPKHEPYPHAKPGPTVVFSSGQAPNLEPSLGGDAYSSVAERRRQFLAIVEKGGGDVTAAGKKFDARQVRDSVLGFWPTEERVPTTKLALDGIAKNGGQAFYGEVDIGNLGALTSVIGETEANGVFRHIGGEFQKQIAAEAKAAGGEAHFFRKGGDEIAVVIVFPKGTKGNPKQLVTLALLRAQAETRIWMQHAIVKVGEKNVAIADIVHPKHADERGKDGVGMTFGVSALDPKKSLDANFKRADENVEAQKNKQALLYTREVIAGELGVPEDKQPLAAREIYALELKQAGTDRLAVSDLRRRRAEILIKYGAHPEAARAYASNDRVTAENRARAKRETPDVRVTDLLPETHRARERAAAMVASSDPGVRLPGELILALPASERITAVDKKYRSPNNNIATDLDLRTDYVAFEIASGRDGSDGKAEQVTRLNAGKGANIAQLPAVVVGPKFDLRRQAAVEASGGYLSRSVKDAVEVNALFKERQAARARGEIDPKGDHEFLPLPKEQGKFAPVREPSQALAKSIGGALPDAVFLETAPADDYLANAKPSERSKIKEAYVFRVAERMLAAGFKDEMAAVEKLPPAAQAKALHALAQARTFGETRAAFAEALAAPATMTKLEANAAQLHELSARIAELRQNPESEKDADAVQAVYDHVEKETLELRADAERTRLAEEQARRPAAPPLPTGYAEVATLNGATAQELTRFLSSAAATRDPALRWRTAVGIVVHDPALRSALSVLGEKRGQALLLQSLRHSDNPAVAAAFSTLIAQPWFAKVPDNGAAIVVERVVVLAERATRTDRASLPGVSEAAGSTLAVLLQQGDKMNPAAWQLHAAGEDGISAIAGWAYRQSHAAAPGLIGKIQLDYDTMYFGRLARGEPPSQETMWKFVSGRLKAEPYRSHLDAGGAQTKALVDWVDQMDLFKAKSVGDTASRWAALRERVEGASYNAMKTPQAPAERGGVDPAFALAVPEPMELAPTAPVVATETTAAPPPERPKNLETARNQVEPGREELAQTIVTMSAANAQFAERVTALDADVQTNGARLDAVEREMTKAKKHSPEMKALAEEKMLLTRKIGAYPPAHARLLDEWNAHSNDLRSLEESYKDLTDRADATLADETRSRLAGEQAERQARAAELIDPAVARQLDASDRENLAALMAGSATPGTRGQRVREWTNNERGKLPPEKRAEALLRVVLKGAHPELTTKLRGSSEKELLPLLVALEKFPENEAVAGALGELGGQAFFKNAPEAARAKMAEVTATLARRTRSETPEVRQATAEALANLFALSGSIDWAKLPSGEEGVAAATATIYRAANPASGLVAEAQREVNAQYAAALARNQPVSRFEVWQKVFELVKERSGGKVTQEVIDVFRAFDDAGFFSVRFNFTGSAPERIAALLERGRRCAKSKSRSSRPSRWAKRRQCKPRSPISKWARGSISPMKSRIRAAPSSSSRRNCTSKLADKTITRRSCSASSIPIPAC